MGFDGIPIEANRGVTGMTTALAILAFGVRTYIRARIVRQFGIEDALLIFAILCLITNTALVYITLETEYEAYEIMSTGLLGPKLLPFLDKLVDNKRIADAMATIWWLCIYAVKLAYLFFFRKLIERLRNFRIWWWCVTIFIFPAAFVCCFRIYISCAPYDKWEIVSQCTGDAADDRQTRASAANTVIDVLTDMMIASFPVMLLWRITLSMRQKIGLGIMLSLSLVTGILGVAAFAGVHLRGPQVDIVWLAFWQHQECCVAVIMVSITAFRSFIVNKERRKENNPRYTSTYWKRKMLLAGKSADSDETAYSEKQGLPEIPSATLTGMRTVIQRGGMGPKSTVATTRNIDQSFDDDFYEGRYGLYAVSTPVPIQKPQPTRNYHSYSGQYPKFACSTIDSTSTRGTVRSPSHDNWV